jgi:hypothetical protein
VSLRPGVPRIRIDVTTNSTARRRDRCLKSGESQSLDVLGFSTDHGTPEAKEAPKQGQQEAKEACNFNEGLGVKRSARLIAPQGANAIAHRSREGQTCPGPRHASETIL